MIQAVIAALNAGFHIFPVDPMGKTPARLYPNRPKEEAPWTIKWSEWQTSDYGKCLDWWKSHPDCNIGVAVKPSSLLVVDCDIKDDGDGFDQYHDIVGRYGGSVYDFDTYSVKTGGGGAHFYYRWPDNVQASQGSLDSHVDIRSNGGMRGGYVLAAGSITEKGPYAVENPAPVADCPPWLVELVREKPRPVQPFRQPPSGGKGNYSGLVSAVQYAPEGDRNACLLWAARSMCSDGATVEQAEETLSPAASIAGLHDREITATIRSAYRLQSYKEGRT